MAGTECLQRRPLSGVGAPAPGPAVLPRRNNGGSGRDPRCARRPVGSRGGCGRGMRHMGAVGGARRTPVLEWGLVELCWVGGLGRRGACEAGARNLTVGTPSEGWGALDAERDSGVRPARDQDGQTHRSMSRLSALFPAVVVQWTGFFSLGQGPVGRFQRELGGI